MCAWPARCTTSSSCGPRSGAAAARWPRSPATEIGPVAGTTAAIAILFIIVIALAGLGLAVVNALQESAWGTFTIGVSIPLALFMGLYMYRFRKGRIAEATVIGVIGMLLAVVLGKPVAASSIGHWFLLSREQLIIAMARLRLRRVGAAGVAAALPARLSQLVHEDRHDRVPGARGRDRQPELKMPAFSQFTGGGGPIIPGPLFPFAFITIACGAISGFHALIASGTTPKMIDRESRHPPDRLRRDADRRAGRHHGADRRGGDVPRRLLRHQHVARRCSPTLGHPDRSTCRSSKLAVGETVAGRTGGAVSLAVGIAQIFSGLPGMRGLMDYWYHFAIMFEALFILTTIDTGTRVAASSCRSSSAASTRRSARQEWLPGSVVSTLLVVSAWAYFIWTGSISTIWPMFGIANQLLASVALAVGTTIIINMGKARYAWVTAAAARVRGGHDADGRRAERARQLLADGDRARPVAALPGLPEHDADRHHDGLRGRDPRQRVVALHAGAARPDRHQAGPKNRPLASDSRAS